MAHHGTLGRSGGAGGINDQRRVLFPGVIHELVEEFRLFPVQLPAQVLDLFKRDEQQCGGGSIYTLDGKYRTWIEKEYTRMLVDTLPETNHMKINQGCNFSYYRNFINHIDYIFFIAIAVLFAIRRKSRL